MNEAIVVALISGGLSLAGVIISTVSSNINIKHKLNIQQAITETKLEELTREVRLHNNFAQRMPVVENEVKHIVERIDEYHK